MDRTLLYVVIFIALHHSRDVVLLRRDGVLAFSGDVLRSLEVLNTGRISESKGPRDQDRVKQGIVHGREEV